MNDTLVVYCLPAVQPLVRRCRADLQVVGNAANIFNHCGFDSVALAPYECFPDLLESVIPECFYRESRRIGTGPSIKTFGVTALG